MISAGKIYDGFYLNRRRATAPNRQPVRLIAVQSEEALARVGNAADIILAIGYADEEPASPDWHDKARIPVSQLVSYDTL